MKKIIFFLIISALLINISFAETKHADKAGTWYPASSTELSSMLEGYLVKADPKKLDDKIIGLISPHAGYRFSGPVAAYGFKSLKGRNIKVAIIIGFNHSVFHNGIAVSDYDSFQTPLGDIPINKEISNALIAQDKNIYALKKAFYDEQSTEMQIPFLQLVLEDFSIVVLSIGNQTLDNCQTLANALYEVLKDRDDYVLIGSTDMSHYLPYNKNNELDNFTISNIEKFDGADLFTVSSLKGHRLMCGHGAVCATMMASKKLGADTMEILNHANSGDVSFDKRAVVGYLSAAMVTSGASSKKEKKIDGGRESSPTNTKEGVGNMLNAAQRTKMLKLARDSIMFYLKNGKKIEVHEDDPVLTTEMGAFVTLHKSGQLRGCIGNMIGRGPFYIAVRDMAVEAAIRDPRFRPVMISEMKDIDIEVSALSPMEKITDPEKIVMGKHGVMVRQGFRSGVYLPQVATETGWDREQFMNSLCSQKAGIAQDAWKTGECEIYIYTAEVFGEKE